MTHYNFNNRHFKWYGPRETSCSTLLCPNLHDLLTRADTVDITQLHQRALRRELCGPDRVGTLWVKAPVTPPCPLACWWGHRYGQNRRRHPAGTEVKGHPEVGQRPDDVSLPTASGWSGSLTAEDTAQHRDKNIEWMIYIYPTVIHFVSRVEQYLI